MACSGPHNSQHKENQYYRVRQVRPSSSHQRRMKPEHKTPNDRWRKHNWVEEDQKTNFQGYAQAPKTCNRKSIPQAQYHRNPNLDVGEQGSNHLMSECKSECLMLRWLPFKGRIRVSRKFSNFQNPNWPLNPLSLITWINMTREHNVITLSYNLSD